MPHFSSRHATSAIIATAALASLAVLTGCAVGNMASSINPATATRTTTSITGTVHGGQQPIGGSLVQLWETGGGTAGKAATATATLGTGATAGQITSITLATMGSGYTSAPSVVITDTTGLGATAAAILSPTDGTVSSITVSNPGSGYTAPTITLSGGIASNGYGQASIQLIASTTTSAAGAFSFPTANVSTNCKTGPFTYITANGGDPTGSSTSNVNSSIELVAVLGACSGVGSTTSVNMNELTTVAAAYALSNFVTDNTGTISIGAPVSNSQGQSDSQGLADAFANASLLVNSSTGVANASTATVILPTAMINALGNSLAACVNVNTVANPSTNSCTKLFSYTTPPSGTNYITPASVNTPTDTFQAAVNMAKYPGQNVPSILNLASAIAAPFVPTVSVTSASSSTAPNDISLGIVYPNPTIAATVAAGDTAPVSLAIDGNDNIWVLGATNSSGTTSTTLYNYITELTSASAGATLTNTLGSNAALNVTHTVRFGAFDTSGNFFLSDKNSTAGNIIEIAAGQAVSSASELGAFPTVTAGTLAANDWNLALDASQNVWTASYASTCAASSSICDYVEYQKGSSYAPTASFGTPSTAYTTAGGARGVAADTVSTSPGLGTIWATNYYAATSSAAGSTLTALLPPVSPSTSYTENTYNLGSSTSALYPLGIALDASGDAYVSESSFTAGALYYIPQGSSNGFNASPVSTTGQSNLGGIPDAHGSAPASTVTSPFAIGGLNAGPGYVAVDGAGSVWVANYSYNAMVQYVPSLNAFLSPYYGFTPNVSIPALTMTISSINVNTTTTARIYTSTTNNVVAGDQITLAGITTAAYTTLNGGPYTVSSVSLGSGYFTITIPTSTITSGKTTANGTASYPSSTQAVFTCTTSSCFINGVAAVSNNTIGIDRAGTVWTLATNGTLTSIIGTAAATNPVLSAGQTGVAP